MVSFELVAKECHPDVYNSCSRVRECLSLHANLSKWMFCRITKIWVTVSMSQSNLSICLSIGCWEISVWFSIGLTDSLMFHWIQLGSRHGPKPFSYCTQYKSVYCFYPPGAFHHFHAVFVFQVTVQLPLGPIDKFTLRTLHTT